MNEKSPSYGSINAGKQIKEGEFRSAFQGRLVGRTRDFGAKKSDRESCIKMAASLRLLG
jgi:hypothetical protein